MIKLNDSFDIVEAKELFNKSKSEKSSSKYGKISKELITNIEYIEES